MFKSKEAEQTQRLEQVFRARIAEALQSIESKPHSFFAWGRKEPAEDPLAFRAIRISGAKTGIRAGILKLVSAELAVKIGSKVTLDFFETYFEQTFRASLIATRSGANSLSDELVQQTDVAAKYKTQVTKMRNSIQASIYAVAEFIELEGLSGNDAHRAQLDSAKIRQIDSLIHSHYRMRVSGRTLATALSLFRQESEDIAKRIERARTTRSKDTNRLLQLHAVFTYEVADVVVGFLLNFERQGVPELKRLHGEIMDEIAAGRNQLAALENRNNTAWRTRETTLQRFDKYKTSIANRRNALISIERRWNGLLDRIENSEKGVAKLFEKATRNLEMIKLDAKATLTIAGLAAVTASVQDEVAALGAILAEIDHIDGVPITDDDIRTLLNIGLDDEVSTYMTEPKEISSGSCGKALPNKP